MKKELIIVSLCCLSIVAGCSLLTPPDETPRKTMPITNGQSSIIEDDPGINEMSGSLNLSGTKTVTGEKANISGNIVSSKTGSKK